MRVVLRTLLRRAARSGPKVSALWCQLAENKDRHAGPLDTSQPGISVFRRFHYAYFFGTGEQDANLGASHTIRVCWCDQLQRVMQALPPIVARHVFLVQPRFSIPANIVVAGLILKERSLMTKLRRCLKRTVDSPASCRTLSAYSDARQAVIAFQHLHALSDKSPHQARTFLQDRVHYFLGKRRTLPTVTLEDGIRQRVPAGLLQNKVCAFPPIASLLQKQQKLKSGSQDLFGVVDVSPDLAARLNSPVPWDADGEFLFKRVFADVLQMAGGPQVARLRPNIKTVAVLKRRAEALVGRGV
jgi:hypothetical protein